VGEQEPVAGEGVAVAARDAGDEAVAGEPGQVVGLGGEAQKMIIKRSRRALLLDHLDCP
jgi:hypothetical protein